MRRLPQNIEAEQTILGAMILSRNAVDVALQNLSSDYFYSREHQLIFSAIEYLVSNQMAVDVSTLTAYLVEKNQLDSVGGVEYLTSISQAVYTSANIEYYVRIVSEKALGRRLIDVSEKLAAKGYEDNENVIDLVQEAERKILEVTSFQRLSDFKKSQDVALEVRQQIYDIRNRKDGFTGMKTGYTGIDQLTNGLQKGDLIILAARPSVGKTAFALNIAQSVSNLNDMPVAIFSLEMGADQLMKRMLSAAGRIDGSKLRDGKLSQEEELKLGMAIELLSKNEIYIDDTPSLKVVEIASKTRKLKREKGLGLIVIDYLQLISGPDNSRESRQLEVSEISRSLKGLARELEVPIIALSQLSREVEKREQNRPRMSDLRESGAIEQDADIVAFLYREDYHGKGNVQDPGQDTVEIEVIFAKHRNGATGTVKLNFEKNHNKFLNQEHRYDNL